MTGIDIDVANAVSTLNVTLSRFLAQNADSEPFRNTFRGLLQETAYLKAVKKDIQSAVGHFRVIGRLPRIRRSLLPFVGDGLSWFFGTVRETDLDLIRQQVSSMAKAQHHIIHAVEQSLTVMNESRILICENRQSIIGIIGSLREIDVKINNITNEFVRKINENRRVLEVYTRLSLVLEEIRIFLENARTFLLNLQGQVDYLALGKISTRVISPPKLRTLLKHIQAALLKLMALISDPDTDIWSFYCYLTNTTSFMDGKIVIVLSKPMIRLDETYELYRTVSIPVPAPVPIRDISKLKETELLASYQLEANGFLIDKAMNTSYSLTRS